jgi:crotonobetainyl-CoA:carnitine CoA-transferase CaiB-like acyl-CoA transferase
VRQEIEAIIRSRDRDEWFDVLVKADVCVGKVYDVEEAVRDPQVLHRQMVVDIEHPVHGKIKQFGIALKMSDTPGEVRSAAPYTGEHTDEVLGTLGLRPDEIRALREKKVVA